MTERLSISPADRPKSASASAQPERRQTRRAGVSLQARVRTANFTDGTFEEVRTTQNASRKAIYFFTTLDRYYKGMRLRVVFPYNANAGAANLEQDGEVVRVHRKDGGYGVAVALGVAANSPSARPRPSASYAQVPSERPSATRSPGGRSSADVERRCATRASFIAPVELIDMRTGSRIQARVSDLSLRGCYVDTLNPLPQGASVRLQIVRHADAFDALAQVSSTHTGSGMGLVFSELTLAQSSLLRAWLGESALPPEIAFSAARPAIKSSQTIKTTQNVDANTIYAVRLIQALVRKGILSQSEATELLRDPGT